MMLYTRSGVIYYCEVLGLLGGSMVPGMADTWVVVLIYEYLPRRYSHDA